MKQLAALKTRKYHSPKTSCDVGQTGEADNCAVCLEQFFNNQVGLLPYTQTSSPTLRHWGPQTNTQRSESFPAKSVGLWNFFLYQELYVGDFYCTLTTFF